MSPRRRDPHRHLGPWAAATIVAAVGAVGPVAAADAPRAPVVTIEDALTPQFASQLRLCLRATRAAGAGEQLGLQRVNLAVACPGVAVRLGAGPLPGMRGRWLGEDGSMSLRQLGDLLRLVEAAAEPKPFVGQLSSLRLQAIIESLDPAARGELSTRMRLARWWRSLIGEFDPTQRGQEQRRRRVEWPLGLWSSVSWIAFATAALLVASVLVQEIRAALALRMSRRRREPRRAPPRAASIDLAALDALPPRERAGAMLRAVAARLHESGTIMTPDPLTPREVQGGARLPDQDRAALAAVTSTAEIGAYGREEPSPSALAQARHAAARWLAIGGSRRWPWPRPGAGRAA
jgi:hypothetical protein